MIGFWGNYRIEVSAAADKCRFYATEMKRCGRIYPGDGVTHDQEGVQGLTGDGGRTYAFLGSTQFDEAIPTLLCSGEGATTNADE